MKYSAESNMKPVWTECGGKGPNIVFADAPDLAVAAQTAAFMIFLNTGSERSHTMGVRTDDKMQGDITATHVAWDREKRNASESCPVLFNGMIFQTTRGGVVSCIDAKTGSEIWEDRLQGQHLPSPILAGDRLYFSNDRGEVNVVRAANKFEVIATNKFSGGADDKITSSPAVAEGAIFIRTKTHLFKIATK